MQLLQVLGVSFSVMEHRMWLEVPFSVGWRARKERISPVEPTNLDFPYTHGEEKRTWPAKHGDIVIRSWFLFAYL
jgi:hypothetical protein